MAKTRFGAVADRFHRMGDRVRTARQTKGTPLSVALMIIVLVISGMGLFAFSIAAQRTLQDVTYESVDGDLNRALSGWATNQDIFSVYGNRTALPPNDFWVAWIYPDGSTSVNPGRNENSSPNLEGLYANTGPRTVQSTDDSTDKVEWRAVATSVSDGRIIVVAKDISRESTILSSFAIGELVIGLIILVLLALIAFYAIKRTLRPLREVEETATAIAKGDLDRRVPQWPVNTEIGSLALALNQMLERLQQSIVELQEKEDQMRRFVGDASHELRTPLTSVKGYAELYRSGATKDADLVVDKIESEASRMSLLVEDLLALTRAEGARHEEKPVDLLELNLSVASSLRAAYPGRNIAVKSEVTNVPMVMGDAARLHQVFTNLVVNALKHGGEDASVEISVGEGTLVRPSGPAPSVVVNVTDDGVGMSEKDASHIFERFYRADTSRTRATGGSGLGLAITKSLVESHGGAISVSSVKGEGTTFRVEIPMTPVVE
ncbi:sensor histidine kinase [Corynebacterium vitaeruminis]|uniref:histidine kinase n=1 Tax=Corynebacterium vitaeruminis DSM 20294 TaxID=1224164 RepID=W5Y2Y2_9CORY|nr:Sensor histidine kinase mtrB [Corynebacterium vitaeruminis DSM 20294]